MRKTMKIVSIIIVSLLLLTGCSSNVVTHVSNADEVIIDIKDNQITKDEIYKYLKLRFGPNLVTTNLIDMQLDKHVTLDDEDKAEGQKRLDETKELLKDEFEEVIAASGYTDEEDYYERVILSKIKNEKLFKTYLDENIEDITVGLNTRKIKKIVTDSKPVAEQALKELSEKEELTVEDFVLVAKEYSTEEEKGITTFEHVFEDRENLKFLNTKLVDAKPGLINEVIMDGDSFYIIYVEEIDLEADKNEIIGSMIQNENVNQIVSQSMFAYYSNLGDFKIHDSDLYDLFKESNPFLVN